MNTIDLMEFGRVFREDYDQPTLLYQDGDHRIFWLGVPEATAFRSNTYLIVDNDEGLLVDPGGNNHFEFVKDRVSQIIAPERVAGQILSHQDPDVAASFPLWVEVNPYIKVIASGRTLTLLSYFKDIAYASANISDFPEYRFVSGKSVRFIPSPFLHSPGAFTTYDPESGFLFSGDLWSAVDIEWTLVVQDFQRHELKLNLFHLDYMASNRAARGYMNQIRGLEVQAILPQHGSIIPREFLPLAFDYLYKLNCGLDIIYPDL